MTQVRQYPRSAPRPARNHPVRSALSLIVIAVGLGVALAASLGAVIWLLSAALHSAATA